MENNIKKIIVCLYKNKDRLYVWSVRIIYNNDCAEQTTYSSIGNDQTDAYNNITNFIKMKFNLSSTEMIIYKSKQLN